MEMILLKEHNYTQSEQSYAFTKGWYEWEQSAQKTK